MYNLQPCEKCLEELGDERTKFAWLQLITIRNVSPYIEISSQTEEEPLEMVVLEKMRFICSTERMNSVLIKILGSIVTNQKNFYLCAKHARHYKDLHEVQNN